MSTADPWEEARKRAVASPPPAVRVKPLGFGCAALLAVIAWAGATFAIGLAAAIVAHRWGLT